MSLVAPPWLRGVMWWIWQAAGGWSQPGAAQCRSRVVTARRRWAGMRSVTVPTSRGRLMEAAGPVRVPVRSQDARPPGPESSATALRRISSRAAARDSRSLPSLLLPLLPGGWVRVGFGPGSAGELGGEAVQEVVVDVAGEDGGQGGVAVVAGSGGGAGRHRAGAVPAGAVPAVSAVAAAGAGQEAAEGEVQVEAGGLPGAVGQAPGREQPPARFFQGVVAALGLAAGVLGAGFLPQRVQDGVEGGGAPAGQVAVQLPGAAQGGGQPQGAVREPAVIVAVGAGGPAPDLLRQVGEGGQVGAVGGGGEQDHVGVGAAAGGEQVGPLGDLPRPRHRDLPAGQRGGDRGMVTE